jgi:tRNA(Arg) A34 adenosine deaminase TadA
MSLRRTFIAKAFTGAAAICSVKNPAIAAPKGPDARWYEAAVEMRRLAESWGDQSYGAVLVAGDAIVGEGPSRVVKDRNPDAHAERVAILDAQRRLGRERLVGSVLYSTSRPCSLCEAAASRAGVSRMYFGHQLNDAGSPSARPL